MQVLCPRVIYDLTNCWSRFVKFNFKACMYLGAPCSSMQNALVILGRRDGYKLNKSLKNNEVFQFIDGGMHDRMAYILEVSLIYTHK